MSVCVTLRCDCENTYGVCASQSWPAGSVEEAVRVAEAQGWLYRPGRDGRGPYVLCPGHAGVGSQ